MKNLIPACQSRLTFLFVDNNSFCLVLKAIQQFLFYETTNLKYKSYKAI